MAYEPWRDFFRHPPRGTYMFDKGYFNITRQSFPEASRDLTIFEGFNEDYNTIHCTDMAPRYWPCPPELVRTPSSAVGATLTKRSLSLGRLSASYIVDAEDFFKASDTTWIWNSLTSMSLTPGF
ncbi:hypothetical protein TOPH_03122 [Tolypocladium ophioglossoides CBS 100239]|uniref:DUF6546 domain-containing protein n=1 Tax=Tolypocladium ophioglossoides (strain CBS 100239) TaxID=1163406 RepID=A0A0L0NDS1_TOLOC|nr:hypothetical protein TOPH_03122 [Tolypocladium ophioglossoides CBS 100239]